MQVRVFGQQKYTVCPVDPRMTHEGCNNWRTARLLLHRLMQNSMLKQLSMR